MTEPNVPDEDDAARAAKVAAWLESRNTINDVPAPPRRNGRTKWIIIGCAVVVGVAALAHAGTTSSGSSDSGRRGAADPASLLAKYDGASGHVASYSAALDAWQAKCTDSRVNDAGYADAVYRDEQKNGVDESRLTIMRNLAASVPASMAPTSCAGVAAAYLVLVETSP